MDITRLLVRMALWVRRPPSRQQLIIIAVVIAASLAIAAAERLFGWPDALTVERLPRWPVPR
ncbi:MAG TPA: hypothetical protein VN240_03500 [Propylenella sp.]|nr:hypothetical protein [Propylenella sp.]